MVFDKSQLDGFRFDSKFEAAVYLVLKRGFESDVVEIKNQDAVYLDPTNPLAKRIRVKIDFRLTKKKVHSGQEYFEWHEAKGMGSEKWADVVKRWPKVGPGDLVIWGGTYSYPKIVKIIRVEKPKLQEWEK